MSILSLPPQKQLTTMLGHPAAENPIDRMFDAVYAHHGLHWQFWKCDLPTQDLLPTAIAGVRALGFAGACITVPYRMASIRKRPDARGGGRRGCRLDRRAHRRIRRTA